MYFVAIFILGICGSGVLSQKDVGDELNDEKDIFGLEIKLLYILIAALVIVVIIISLLYICCVLGLVLCAKKKRKKMQKHARSIQSNNSKERVTASVADGEEIFIADDEMVTKSSSNSATQKDITHSVRTNELCDLQADSDVGMLIKHDTLVFGDTSQLPGHNNFKMAVEMEPLTTNRAQDINSDDMCYQASANFDTVCVENIQETSSLLTADTLSDDQDLRGSDQPATAKFKIKAKISEETTVKIDSAQSINFLEKPDAVMQNVSKAAESSNSVAGQHGHVSTTSNVLMERTATIEVIDEETADVQEFSKASSSDVISDEIIQPAYKPVHTILAYSNSAVSVKNPLRPPSLYSTQDSTGAILENNTTSSNQQVPTSVQLSSKSSNKTDVKAQLHFGEQEDGLCLTSPQAEATSSTSNALQQALPSALTSATHSDVKAPLGDTMALKPKLSHRVAINVPHDGCAVPFLADDAVNSVKLQKNPAYTSEVHADEQGNPKPSFDYEYVEAPRSGVAITNANSDVKMQRNPAYVTVSYAQSKLKKNVYEILTE